MEVATAEAAPPPRDDAARDSLESSYGAPSRQGAVFQKAVAIASTPEVAMNSHQVLSDSLPGAAATAAAGSLAPSCGCRDCSVLAVSTGDGAEAWDTTIDQAPLVIDGVVSLGTGVDLSKVFQLHSNPTATKTIFLDFDGYAINNTPWENGGNLSLNKFYTSFDAAALTEIQRIWQRVAEDFAPFNLNVTTEDPGSESLRKYGTADDRWGIRVAFTSNLNLLTGKAIINAGGGGTAYYNSFNWSTDDVALVFNRGEYSAAATASHEVGHTLNLTHDGAGTTTAYYAGHGGTGPTSWGTIMGAPYLGDDENVTQWSKGEYTGANNTQDDLAVITGSNGFSYATDDHGSSFTTATALTGLTFSSFGVIERNTDIDMFRFETLAGQVSFNIVNAARAYIGSSGTYTTNYLAARGPNLDIAATLYRADQSIVQTFNPADLTTASFSTYLDAGTYYLGIDGVGFGTPLASTPTGYTDYGSLGQYMVSGTLPSTSQPPLPPQVLDPNGAVELLRDPNTDLISVRSNGVTAAVRLSGAQITASQFGDRQILAAETINGVNKILWKVVSTGQVRTWSLDGNWNHVTSDAIVNLDSSEGLLLQQQFMVDATGTPLTSTSTLPLISLAVSPASVLENGAANLIYTFSRTGATTNPLTVSYSIGGTATNGSDYGLIPASVTFAAGSATATVTVDPTADAVVEPDETVSLTLQSNAAYSIGTAGAVGGTILNDDATPPPTTTLQVLDPNGAVELLRDTSSDLVSVRSNGVTAAVRLSGAQITASQFGDRQILAAETINGVNKILWKVVSTG
ncbi:Calx-beta domain-containing protein, partial [Synechococcus sp. BA-132 BA5]|uniref:Calx-beta domain-containing protein n=1 Tax=Synechococcus sp. BA-132 BA5 TaxID=3110252 RepID=UPI002B202188